MNQEFRLNYGIIASNLGLSNYALTSQIPTNVSQLTNDTGYITGYNAGSGISIENGTINCTVQGGGGGGGPTYTAGEGIGISDQNVISLTATIPTVPSNVGAFTNDVGYLTAVPSDTATTGWVEEQGFISGISVLYGDENFAGTAPTILFDNNFTASYDSSSNYVSV